MKENIYKRTLETIMERYPLLYNAKTYKGKWSYDYGVILKGFEKIWELTGEEKYFKYIKDNLDYFINEDGTIKGYTNKEFNIDHLNNGKLLFSLFNHTKDEKYKKAAKLLRDQLYNHPRTSEGAFFHKKIYPYQIWLDGLYMGSPFYLEYLLTFENGENVSDVSKQFIICEKNNKDKDTGLLRHGFDEKRVQPWCDKETGLSENPWSRSLGWFVMALADVLEIFPKDHKDYKELVRIFKDTLTAIVKYQDKESGVWYQVVDKGGCRGNYLEASGSSMIVYALTKGILLGILEEENMRSSCDKGYEGLLSEFILLTKEGFVNLNKTCEVAGLGGEDRRDGTYTYYISEPIITNDFKGLGAFLQASIIYEILLKEREEI